VYHPGLRTIFASVPGAAGTTGNSITPIDPFTGAVGAPVFVGSEPRQLALAADGRTLYVGLDGAAAVRQVDVLTQTAGLQFSLGSDPFTGPFYAEDIAVLPQNPDAVVVSRRNSGSSSRHEGVAIYDHGVQRPAVTPEHTGSNVIEFCGSSSTLYGYNNETTEFGFRRMVVGPDGVSVLDVTQNLISGFGVDIICDAGLIYTSTGRVIDPAMRTLVGTYGTFAPDTPFRPDSTTGRTIFLVPTPVDDEYDVVVYYQRTFAPVGRFPVKGVVGKPHSLIRWGDYGLAFRTTGGQVFILRFHHP
jgi:hypothetical protein